MGDNLMILLFETKKKISNYSTDLKIRKSWKWSLRRARLYKCALCTVSHLCCHSFEASKRQIGEGFRRLQMMNAALKMQLSGFSYRLALSTTPHRPSLVPATAIARRSSSSLPCARKFKCMSTSSSGSSSNLNTATGNLFFLWNLLLFCLAVETWET